MCLTSQLTNHEFGASGSVLPRFPMRDRVQPLRGYTGIAAIIAYLCTVHTRLALLHFTNLLPAQNNSIKDLGHEVLHRAQTSIKNTLPGRALATVFGAWTCWVGKNPESSSPMPAASSIGSSMGWFRAAQVAPLCRHFHPAACSRLLNTAARAAFDGKLLP